jgi:hypothetical protein
MGLLLIGASWLLVVLLVLGLCAAARDGRAMPEDAHIGAAPKAGRFHSGLVVGARP